MRTGARFLHPGLSLNPPRREYSVGTGMLGSSILNSELYCVFYEEGRDNERGLANSDQ